MVSVILVYLKHYLKSALIRSQLCPVPCVIAIIFLLHAIDLRSHNFSFSFCFLNFGGLPCSAQRAQQHSQK